MSSDSTDLGSRFHVSHCSYPTSPSIRSLFVVAQTNEGAVLRQTIVSCSRFQWWWRASIRVLIIIGDLSGLPWCVVRYAGLTRCSPRTRMLTHMLMVQMSKHVDMQSRRTLFCNSLFEQSCTYFPCYQSAVRSGKCRVWSVECRVRSVEYKVWSGECRVCRVWSVECRVWSVECRVWSEECRVRSVQCKV